MNNELLKLIPILRRYAYTFAGNLHDADDLVQNTLERVLKKPPPEGVELAKWAFRICRNLWVDEYRAATTRQNATEEPHLQAQATTDGERDVTHQIEFKQVYEAMQLLNDDQRTVMALVTIEGMSYQEAATVIDKPVGTVMSRLARARAALAMHLQTMCTPMASR